MKKFFFFFFFLNFFLISPSKTLEINKCTYNVDNIQDYNLHENIRHLEVKVKKNRDWLVNSLKIGIGNFRFIPNDFKKKFEATVIVNYKNDTICEHEARVRFSGDMKDHVEIDLNNNKINQSIDVKLKQGNILGITNFKLLLTKTRGEDEILISALLRNFGYLAPRTYLTNVKVDNQNIGMIFQEKNRKELLEINKRRETVILEGDERFIFLKSQNIPLDNKSNHAAGLVPLLKVGFKSMLAKQKNSNLILKNESLELMSLNVLSNLNKIYLKYSNNFDKNSKQVESYRFYTLENQMLGFNNRKNVLFLDVYNLIVMATSDGHSLMPSNRQFYWNSFEHFFEPVSYDGNFKITDNSNILIEPLSENFGEAFYKFEELINNLDIPKLNRNINNYGLSQSLEKTEEKIKNLKINVGNIKKEYKKKSNDKKIHNKINLQEYVKNIKKINSNFKFIKINENNQFELCEVLERCQNINLTKLDTVNLLRADLEKDGKPYQFIGKTIQDENLINNINLKKKIYKKTVILHDENINLSLNEEKREINIFQLKKDAKIAFLGGEIKNKTINFYGSKTNLESNLLTELSPIDINGLTGCLTFINTIVDNIILNSENSNCEDAINFINTSGNIKEIKIKNAFSDGLDIDFSDLDISLVEVENAGNDCSDFSFGNYDIKKFKLSNCGDKSISAGEKSLLKAGIVSVEKSNIGIASKDSSEVFINEILLNKVQTCLAAYNKKQEFLGGLIDIKKISCKDYMNYADVDQMSKIKTLNNNLQTNLLKPNF